MHYDDFTKNDYQNEIEYLRTALGTAIRAMSAIRDNLETGRFSVTVLDDGNPKPANIDAMLEALHYCEAAEQNTNPYLDHKEV